MTLNHYEISVKQNSVFQFKKKPVHFTKIPDRLHQLFLELELDLFRTRCLFLYACYSDCLWSLVKMYKNQVTHFLHITNITSHTSNSCYYRLQNPLQNNLFHQFYLYCLATSSERMTIYINRETRKYVFYNKKMVWLIFIFL